MRRSFVAGGIAGGALALAAAAADTRISVVVPADPPLRPAHFHWKFRSSGGRAVRTGQFACGSHWVAPAEGDDGVTLVALDGAPEWRSFLSCDADPLTERHGLLSGKNRYGNHDPSENVLASLPATFRPPAGSCVSLVAAQQRDEEQTRPGGTRQILGEVADAYCVITVMPAPPANGGADMIRPNITGARKEFLTWADFALERLPKYDFLERRSSAQWETARRRWAHAIEIFGLAAETPDARSRNELRFRTFSEGGRAFRAHLLVPDYASGTARLFNGDVLALFAAGNAIEDLKPALAAMLAYGLDLYHARYENGPAARKGWVSGAGQWMGGFLPPVLAAALLRDESKARRLQWAAVTNHGRDPAEWGPQELRQIRRGVTGVLLWGDGHPILRDGNVMGEQDWRYWADFTGSRCYDGYLGKDRDPNRGKKTAADPYGYIDGPANQP
ncbi:MAG TPA: hypothetical protein PK689_08025, partial [Kiritimatiellia bacterium]|nr:hypothetical protein [Kiritimatiellia bacterium]